MKARHTLLGGILAALSAGILAAEEGGLMLGTWLTPEGMSRVEIKKCESTYCGVITWMKTPKTDEKNSDRSLRGRPLVGAQILTNFEANGTGGKIYAPERGKMTDAKLVLAGPDSLEIRVSAGLVKKTIVWTRVK